MTKQREFREGDRLQNLDGDVAIIRCWDTERVFVRFETSMSIANGKWCLKKTEERNPKKAARIKRQMSISLSFPGSELNYSRIAVYEWDEVDEALEGYS